MKTLCYIFFIFAVSVGISQIDSDGDLVIDFYDQDDDNDGITDRDEMICGYGNTGTWTNTATNEYTSIVNGQDIKVTFSNFGINTGISGFANGTMTSANSSWFSDPNIGNVNSFVTNIIWDNNPETPGTDIDVASDDKGSLIMTVDFGQLVTNPILHIERLGGYGGTTTTAFTNSASFTLITSGVSMTRLAGTNDFQVFGNVFQKRPNVVITAFNSLSSQNASDGTAAGSIRFNGTFSQISFSVTGVGVEGLGYDNIEFIYAGDICGDRDTDLDLIVDRLDLDSDADMCPDVVEAGYTDVDGDEKLGGLPLTVNSVGRVSGPTVVDGYTGNSPEVIDGLPALTIACSIVLPVELCSFKGLNNDCVNDLEWILCSQNNCKFITLQRSYDGENWKNIYTVDGAGTTNSEMTYRFSDKTANSSVTAYYRLFDMSYDGTSDYSDEISITNNCNDSENLILTKDQNAVYVTLKSGDLIKSFNLYDFSGRIIHTVENSSDDEQLSFPLYSDNSQIYILKAKTFNGNIITTKVFL